MVRRMPSIRRLPSSRRLPSITYLTLHVFLQRGEGPEPGFQAYFVTPYRQFVFGALEGALSNPALIRRLDHLLCGTWRTIGQVLFKPEKGFDHRLWSRPACPSHEVLVSQ